MGGGLATAWVRLEQPVLQLVNVVVVLVVVVVVLCPPFPSNPVNRVNTQPIAQVMDEETGTHKAKDLPSRFDHNRHAKKQGGRTGGAAAAAAQALGKLAEARKESSSSSIAVERDKVDVMRINGQAVRGQVGADKTSWLKLSGA